MSKHLVTVVRKNPAHWYCTRQSAVTGCEGRATLALSLAGRKFPHSYVGIIKSFLYMYVTTVVNI